MLVVSNLVKQCGDVVAVESISFEARKGSVFGLLGPNGAGKSTTIKCLYGLLQPISGSISVGGLDVPRQAKAVSSPDASQNRQRIAKLLFF